MKASAPRGLPVACSTILSTLKEEPREWTFLFSYFVNGLKFPIGCLRHILNAEYVGEPDHQPLVDQQEDKDQEQIED